MLRTYAVWFYTMFRTIAPLARAPFALRRPFSSTARLPLARSLVSPVAPLKGPVNLLRGQLLVRGAASSVSGRPGSQTIRQAAVNIKEELGNSGADLAKTIAGANWFQDAVAANPKRDTFVSLDTAALSSLVGLVLSVWGRWGSSGSRTRWRTLCHSSISRLA